MWWHPYYNTISRFVVRKAPLKQYFWGILLGVWYSSGVFAYCSTIFGAPLLVIVPLINFWLGELP